MQDDRYRRIERIHLNSMHVESNNTEWVILVKIHFSIKVELEFFEEKIYELPLKVTVVNINMFTDYLNKHFCDISQSPKRMQSLTWP